MSARNGPSVGFWIISFAFGFFTVSVNHVIEAKLITGIAPCPNGVPPARECLVSVLVDLRSFRARARGQNATLQNVNKPNKPAGQSGLEPGVQSGLQPGLELKPTLSPPKDLQPGLNFVPEQDNQAPYPVAGVTAAADGDLQRKLQDNEVQLRREFFREQQEQHKKQFQLEQAVRFQEDELQQLREQVHELRTQLAQALQLYQLTQSMQRANTSPQGGYYQPPAGNLRRFYRNPQDVPPPSTASVYGQRNSLKGLRELARSEVVFAT